MAENGWHALVAIDKRSAKTLLQASQCSSLKGHCTHGLTEEEEEETAEILAAQNGGGGDGRYFVA
jgi:hypothetical protein